MKTTLFASALLCASGTAGLACTAEEGLTYKEAMTAIVQEVVARDEAHLGRVMAIMRDAAVTEYHAGPSAPTCARQAQTLEALTAFAQSLDVPRTAMLKG